MSTKTDKICGIIGYEFKDASFLNLALTHRSAAKLHNERIEFLGDGLVNMIIAEALYKQFPEAKEGELSRLRASLVKGDTLAEIAAEFSLGEYMMLGMGEKKSAGHKRPSILAGAVESIIGAIYLDSDFECCKSVVLTWFERRLKNITLGQQHIDAKTKLQEELQSKHIPLPKYTVIDTIGQAHNQTFVVHCLVEGSEAVEGRGASRRKAEQDAAAHMLKSLGYDK